MADQYITYPLVADAQDLMQKCFDYMTIKFPGWEPSDGQLDTALIEGTSSQAADIATLTTEVPKSIFRYFGAKLVGIPPEEAVAAIATSTWFLRDNIGHIIPAGTQVSITDPQGNSIPFVTLSDVTVLPGASQTAVGGVTLVAVVPGADSSGAGTVNGVVNLVDIISWVDHITQTTVSTGGIDAEDDDAYLNRLSLELQLISPKPILPKDFAILARNADPSVQRATAIDGYNPADGTYNNERMVTVFALTSAGAGVTTGAKANIQSYLDSLRELNFVINTMNPTANTVAVTTTVLMQAGFSQTDVQARVAAAITDFLNPALWGIDPSDDPNNPLTWNNKTTVRYLELAAAIDSVSGVAFVESVTIGTGGPQTAADHVLSGVAPIPNPGAIVVNVDLP